MRLIFFAEDSDVSKRIADSLKSKYWDFCLCTDRFSFFSSIFDNDLPYDVILILSDSVLKDMSTTIDSFMKGYDLYFPVFTFVSSFYSLIIQLNYIQKYATFFPSRYTEIFQKIVNCFYESLKEDTKSLLCSFTENKIFSNGVDEYENTDTGKFFLSPYDIPDKNNIFPELTKAQRRLFTYLLLNKDGVSKDEIVEYLWESSINNKSQNVYVLVATLRSILKEKTDDSCRIVYENKKYRLELFPSLRKLMN